MANIWDRQQHPHSTDVESEALVLWKSIFQTKQHPKELYNKALFKSSRHGPKRVFCKVWAHPAVSYNLYRLSNSVKIPICMDHVRVVSGSHDH